MNGLDTMASYFIIYNKNCCSCALVLTFKKFYSVQFRTKEYLLSLPQKLVLKDEVWKKTSDNLDWTSSAVYLKTTLLLNREWDASDQGMVR